LLALLLALSGCTVSWETNHETLTAAQFAELKLARTKVDVLERVGPPVDAGVQPNGSVFVYRANRTMERQLSLSAFQASFQYFEEDQRSERLVVFFDKKGTMTHYGWDSAADLIPEDPDETEEEETLAPSPR
jgi:hypothetical protein